MKLLLIIIVSLIAASIMAGCAEREPRRARPAHSTKTTAVIPKTRSPDPGPPPIDVIQPANTKTEVKKTTPDVIKPAKTTQPVERPADRSPAGFGVLPNEPLPRDEDFDPNRRGPHARPFGRIGTSLDGGELPVVCVAYAPHGIQMATLSAGGEVRIWNAISGRLVASRRALEPPANWICYSPDAKTLAACSDQQIKLLDSASAKELKAFGQKGPYRQVQFVGDRLFALIREDVQIWDPLKASLTNTIKDAHYLRDRLAVFPDGQTIVGDGDDGAIRLLDARTGEQTKRLPGHTEYVLRAAVSPDGNFLASADGDDVVKIWDIKSAKELHSWKSKCSALQFFPDGKTLAVVSHGVDLIDVTSGAVRARLDGPGTVAGKSIAVAPDGLSLAIPSGYDPTVAVVDLYWTRERSVMPQGEDEPLVVATTPDGRLVAVADAQGYVAVWDAKKGMQSAKIKIPGGHAAAIALAPNGRILATAADGELQLWDLSSKSIIDGFKVPESNVLAVAFSPSGERLAVGGGVFEDAQLLLVEAATGKVVHKLGGHASEVRSVRFSADGKLLLSVSEDTVRLFDTSSGESRLKIGAHAQRVLDAHLSADGQWIATIGGRHKQLEAKVWRTKDGGLVYQTPLTDEQPAAVSISPGGRLLSVGCDQGWLTIHDVTNGQIVARHPAHKLAVNGMASYDKGRRFVTVGKDRLAKLWRLGDLISPGHWRVEGPPAATRANDETLLTEAPAKRLLELPIWAFDVAFSPDGKWVAACGGDFLEPDRHPALITIWDSRTGELKRTLNGHKHAVRAIVFSQDGKTLFSASGSRQKAGVIKAWDMESGEQRVSMAGHAGSIEALDVSPDGATLASVGGFEDYTFRLWDAATGRQIQLLYHGKQPLHDVAFSPDGNLVAVAGSDHFVLIWDVSTGKLRASLEHESPVAAVAFSPDGSRLAAVGGVAERSESKIWSLDTNKVVQELKGHDNEVATVRFSPDGSLLATGSFGPTVLGEIIFWDAKSGKRARTIYGQHENGVDALAFSADGNTLASASADGTVRLWDVDRVLDLKLERQLAVIRQAGGTIDESTSELTVTFQVDDLVSSGQIALLGKITSTTRLNLTGSDHLTEAGLRSIQGLTNLRSLNLSGCSRINTDAIKLVARFPKLQQLILADCKAIDDASLNAIGFLSQLEHLDLSRTSVTGSGFSSLKNLEHLKRIDLQEVPLSEFGMIQLGGLTRLAQLNLTDCFLDAARLAKLEPLQGLRRLDLSTFHLTDAELAKIAPLRGLREINLSGTSITDKGLAALAQLKQLEQVDLTSTDISDMGLAHLATLKQLKDLRFAGAANITGAGLAVFADTPNLTRLDLSLTSVTDKGLAGVGRLNQLVFLSLPQETSDVGLTHLKGLKNLETLILDYTSVSDKGLASLAGLTKLRKLALTDVSGVTGSGIASLSEAENLFELDLRSTGVTDAGLAGVAKVIQLRRLQLPERIGDLGVAHLKQLKNLEEVDLEDSQVTDAGLTHLGGLSKLRVLVLIGSRTTRQGVQVLGEKLKSAQIHR